MFRVLLVFAAISAAYSQSCANFDDIPNDPDLLDEYTGTYYLVRTTTMDTVPCEKITFTGTGSERVGVVESLDCCRTLSNFNTTNPDYVGVTVTPVTFGPNCLQSTILAQLKFVLKLQVPFFTCIVTAICRQGETVFIVQCKQTVIPTSLLNIIILLLKVLVASIFDVSEPPVFNLISQVNCLYPEDLCLV